MDWLMYPTSCSHLVCFAQNVVELVVTTTRASPASLATTSLSQEQASDVMLARMGTAVTELAAPAALATVETAHRA
jgi:hypothetical protein